MKKKVIRNTFLLLLIPILVTLIVFFIYNKKLDNVFYDPINYETNNNTVITDNNIINYNYSDDFIDYDFLIIGVNKYYKLYMYFSIILVLIFSFIYSFVMKNKKW